VAAFLQNFVGFVLARPTFKWRISLLDLSRCNVQAPHSGYWWSYMFNVNALVSIHQTKIIVWLGANCWPEDEDTRWREEQITKLCVLFQKSFTVSAGKRVFPKILKVFERDIIQSGRSEESLAATTPCRLQLCAVSRNSATKYPVTALQGVTSQEKKG